MGEGRVHPGQSASPSQYIKYPKLKNYFFLHRILAYGDNLLATIVPNSAKPFNFQKEFDLTEKMVRYRSKVTSEFSIIY